MHLPEHLSLSALHALPQSITLSPDAHNRISKNREFLDRLLEQGNTYYGINTGFGSLCNVRIKTEELAQLQENLVCSHAAGMGDEVPAEIVKLMLLLKIHGLSLGYSGVHTALVQRLADLYNNNVLPVVYEQGSLGASGDLAPLAHLSLPLIGKGEVYYNNEKMPALAALQQLGLAPLTLSAKEGLALLNGTQFMSSYASWCLLEAQRLLDWADHISALSADAYLAKAEPFTHLIHKVRPHKGQVDTARKMQELLQGSALQQQSKHQVQDPYSFRCIPQVHGATRDVVAHAVQVIETEINSATDNPIVFDEEELILSGGNFHGQPLALQLDFLAIALAELANISERRTYLLISGQRDLPAFLAEDAGLNSGFMIAQYTAASIVSQNKQLCTPASVDSIVSSNGQEDHVSMGANAATKLRKVIQNVQRVLAIELLTAAQAIDFRKPYSTAPVLSALHTAFRKNVSFMEKDRVLHSDMTAAEHFLQQSPVSYTHKA